MKKLFVLITLLSTAALYSMETDFYQLKSQVSDAILKYDHTTLKNKLEKISRANMIVPEFTFTAWSKQADQAKETYRYRPYVICTDMAAAIASLSLGYLCAYVSGSPISGVITFFAAGGAIGVSRIVGEHNAHDTTMEILRKFKSQQTQR